MDVVEVAVEIVLALDRVFPKPRLPDAVIAALALLAADGLLNTA